MARTNMSNLLGNWRVPLHANPGLWFDKYLGYITDAENAEKDSAKTEHVRQTAMLHEPVDYRSFYDARLQILRNIAVCREAEVVTRLAIGMGSESAIETNIALHRVYGTPVISGSSIKGLVSHFLIQYGGENWARGSENHCVVCGDELNAGYLTFHDALYVPGSGKEGKALHMDVMTPHHSKYYDGSGKPPADWDTPTLVPFLSATGRYLIAISGPSDWVKIVFKILEYAIRFEGVGAKTSSGYGRMVFSRGFVQNEQDMAQAADRRLIELIDEMEKLVSSDKETRKATKRKLKEFTRGFSSENESDVAAARKIDEKAIQLNIKDDLKTTKPDWFEPIRIILDE